MSRNYRLYLADIRQSCHRILAYTAGFTFEDFKAEQMHYDAVMFNLMIVGEAIKQMAPQFRAAHPDIEWQKISRFRDIIVHRYFGLDNEIVWEIVQKHIPDLQQELAAFPETEFIEAGEESSKDE